MPTAKPADNSKQSHTLADNIALQANLLHTNHKKTPSYVFGVCAKEGGILVGPVEYRKSVEEAVVTEGGI